MTFSGGRWPSGPYGGIVERDVLLTQEGYEKLQEELQSLSTDKRREVADRIRVAREFGDISENSEFDDAKNEQMMLEKQIAKLEERLRSARIIDPSEADAGQSTSGSRSRSRMSIASATRPTASSARPRPIRRPAASRTSLRSDAR